MDVSSNNIEIAVWGLKLGHQIFFNSSGLDAGSHEVVDVLEDIRGVVNFSSPGISFHSVELSDRYQIFSVYRTIYDWVGREGYFAISLFVPQGKAMAPGKCLELLQELLRLYENNYIDERNKIKNYKEDIALFTREIEKVGSLVPAPPPVVKGSGNRYARVSYSGKADLERFLDSPSRQEYAAFKEIFFIDDADTRLRLSPNVVTLDVSPVVSTLSFTVTTTLPDGKKYDLIPAGLLFKVNNQPVSPQIDKILKRGRLSNLKPGNVVEVVQNLNGVDRVIETVTLGNNNAQDVVLSISETTVVIKLKHYSGYISNSGYFSVESNGTRIFSGPPQNGEIRFSARLGSTAVIKSEHKNLAGFPQNLHITPEKFIEGNGIVMIDVFFNDKSPAPFPSEASSAHQYPNPTKDNARGKETGDFLPQTNKYNTVEKKHALFAVLFLALLIFVSLIYVISDLINSGNGGKDVENSNKPVNHCDRIKEDLYRKIPVDSLKSYKTIVDTSKCGDPYANRRIDTVMNNYKKLEKLWEDMKRYDLITGQPDLKPDMNVDQNPVAELARYVRKDIKDFKEAGCNPDAAEKLYPLLLKLHKQVAIYKNNNNTPKRRNAAYDEIKKLYNEADEATKKLLTDAQKTTIEI